MMSETKETQSATGSSVNQTLRISSKETPTEQRTKCCKCEKVFKNKDKSVKCATCQLTFHAKCQDVSDRKYDTLKEEGDDTMWLCLSCNQVTRGMVQNITNIQQRVAVLEADMKSKADRSKVQQLETRLNNFMQGAKNRLETKADNSKVEELSDRVATIEQKVNNNPIDKDTEELSKLLEAKLKEQQELINQRSNNDCKELVKRLEETIKEQETIKKSSMTKEVSMTEAVKEMEERERRKGNIIIHNVTESSSTDSDTTRNNDVQKINELCEKYLKIDINIKKDQKQQPLVIRLGKKDEKKNRSLKLCLNPDDAQKMLLNAKNLSQAQDPEFKKMIIKPDLTQMQRDEEKKLIEEKNQKNQEAKGKNEPEDWIIQRWKVVRRKKPRGPPKADAKTSTGSLNEEYTDAATGSN